ncbi:MAG: transposase, partial [Erythrobacter sp.]|nr:transposase [Erythrobacter sp.]
MPRLITTRETRAASLAQTLDELGASGFDPHDEDSLDHAARALQRLANNRSFLGELLLDRLAGRASASDSGYGPQAIVLSAPRGEWFLRANIWPSARDTCLKSSGAAHFVYGAPHDHNFDFLTIGYFG